MDYKIFKLILLNHNNEEKVIHYYTSKKSESKDSNTHVIKLYGDDTIENIKYKLCSFLQDTNIDHYSFHYKTREILDPKVKFKKMSKGLNFIQKDDPSKKYGYGLLTLIIIFIGPSIFYYLTNIWS